MLLELMLGGFNNGGYGPNEIVALENIGTMAAAGNHLVVSDRGTLRHLASLQGLSDRSRNAFGSLLTSYASIGGASHFISAKIIVSDSSFVVAAQGEAWVVPLFEFANPTLLQKSHLLAENYDDAKFYIGLALSYQKARLGKSIPISLVPRGGGGQTTNIELKAIIDNGPSFVLCITDGDRNWSGAVPGNVYTACRVTFPSDTWFAKLNHNILRTIENLILFSWLAKTDFYIDNKFSSDKIGTLQNLCSMEMCGYSNMKSVFGLCFYRNHVDQTARAAYINDINVVEPISPCGPAGCQGHCFKFGGLHNAVPQVAELLLSKPAISGRSISEGSAQESLGKAVFEFGVSWSGIRA